MTEEFLTQDHWMELLLVNLENQKMTDAGFRAFVRHNISTVIGHDRLRKGLIERGRLKENTEEPTRLRETDLAAGFQEGYGDHDVPCGSAHHYDRDTEPFHKK